MKNVFIISARRSGTHLLTDLIVNNFNYERINNNIDYDFLTNKNVQKFINVMMIGNKLAWSHYHDYDNFFNENINNNQIQQLKSIFKTSKIIFIYRDIRDVITSYYHRPYIFNNFKSFKDFYKNSDLNDYRNLSNNTGKEKNIVDILLEQYKNWFSVYFAKELLDLDFEIISYEEIVNEYKYSVEKISKFLELPTNPKIKDVRLKSLNEEKSDIIYTHNYFRKGCIGDWTETFGKKWGKRVIVKYNQNIYDHINFYINTPKLHNFHSPERKNFQIESKNWKSIEDHVDVELKKYNGYFNEFTKEFNIKNLLDHRYEICERKYDDVRYKHKVFFLENYVIKFLYPCKTNLDKKTFEYVIPIASKINLLIILNSNDKLYELNIIPKLYYAGIYKNILFVIQERINNKNLISNKFNIHNKFNWIVNNNLFPLILDQFFVSINKHNILLTDHISPYNLALFDNKLKYLDLDGIHCYENKTDLINSKLYSNVINTYIDIDELWKKKNGFSLLDKYDFYKKIE